MSKPNNKAILLDPAKRDKDPSLNAKIRAVAASRNWGAASLVKDLLPDVIGPLYDALPDEFKVELAT